MFALETGDYPDLLKSALVKAIYKKGIVDQEINYRPFNFFVIFFKYSKS